MKWLQLKDLDIVQVPGFFLLTTEVEVKRKRVWRFA